MLWLILSFICVDGIHYNVPSFQLLIFQWQKSRRMGIFFSFSYSVFVDCEKQLSIGPYNMYIL